MPGRLVLVPSPFMGKSEFFAPLAAALRRQGFTTSVINLVGRSNAEMAGSAALQAHRAAGDAAVVLVPFSGAGPLSPAVLAGFPAGQASVVFLDASPPHPGRSRLDEMRQALPPEALAELERQLRGGASWPDWGDAEIAALVPDAATRRSLLATVTPRPLSFFEEPLPQVEVPSHVASGYLRLSAAYDPVLEAGRSRGWPTRSLDLTHFAPYTHPAEVGAALASLVREMSEKRG